MNIGGYDILVRFSPNDETMINNINFRTYFILPSIGHESIIEKYFHVRESSEKDYAVININHFDWYQEMYFGEIVSGDLEFRSNNG